MAFGVLRLNSRISQGVTFTVERTGKDIDEGLAILTSDVVLVCDYTHDMLCMICTAGTS